MTLWPCSCTQMQKQHWSAALWDRVCTSRSYSSEGTQQLWSKIQEGFSLHESGRKRHPSGMDYEDSSCYGLVANSTGKQTSPGKTTIYIVFCRKEVLCDKSFLDLGPHSTKIWKVRLIEGPLSSPGWSTWKRRMCLICTRVQYCCSGVLYLCTFGFLLMKKN